MNLIVPPEFLVTEMKEGLERFGNGEVRGRGVEFGACSAMSFEKSLKGMTSQE